MKKGTSITTIIKRQKFHYIFFKPIFFIISRLFLHFRSKAKYKIDKDEAVIIIANHQTDADFIHMLSSFNKPISFVATDNIFSSKFGKFLLNHLGVIPKKKGTTDLKTTLSIMRVLNAKGAVYIAVEGNRTYAEFQYFISKSIITLLQKSKATLVLYRFEGGTGVSPRFKNKNRKGRFSATITKVLKYDEYKDIPDDELFNIIKDNIKYYDSESGELYKSRRRAEYLEKMLFVCPKCLKMNTLVSNKEHLVCNNCSLDVIYNEDLSLSCKDDAFQFTRLLDWWNFQKRYVKDLEINDGPIFEDEVILKSANAFSKRKILFKGKMILTKDELIFGGLKHQLKDLEIGTVVSGGKLIYMINNDTYLIKSKNKRFNPLKYMFMFNKLDTAMANKHLDMYYNLEEN